MNSATETPRARRGQAAYDAQKSRAATGNPCGDSRLAGDHARSDTHPRAVAGDLLSAIGDVYRVYRALVQTQGAMGLRIKANERQAATFRLRATGKEPPPGKMAVPTAADRAVVARLYPSYFEAVAVLKRQRRVEARALTTLVKKLPVMSWAQQVRGLGALSVAAMVGEAGDPGNYSNPAKLWKRYGLAVVDGQRQRLVAGAEAAALHGYSPSRRAALYVIGSNLMMTSNHRAREIYDEVKARELAKDLTPAHAHNRALRIVQKKLVVAFWLAWRSPDEPPPSAMVWTARKAAMTDDISRPDVSQNDASSDAEKWDKPTNDLAVPALSQKEEVSHNADLGQPTMSTPPWTVPKAVEAGTAPEGPQETVQRGRAEWQQTAEGEASPGGQMRLGESDIGIPISGRDEISCSCSRISGLEHENEQQRVAARDYLKASLQSVETMLAGVSHEEAEVRQGLKNRRATLVRELAELNATMVAGCPGRGWQHIGDAARRVVDKLKVVPGG